MSDLVTAGEAIGAEVRGANVGFARVTTDSRDVRAGDLFVALCGERFDGHDFVARALERGAAAALVARDRAGALAGNLLVAADPLVALGQLAAWWRGRFQVPLVAVTGSNGKTTVKEMLAAILRLAAQDTEAVLATEGNLNNHIGMPLTLLRLRAQHRYAVIEMGMNHPGEIRYLTGIARPTVALINNAQAAHLEGLGSVEAVARAKGEIFEGLGADGVAVINAADMHAPLWQSLAAPHRTLTFGIDARARVRAEDALDDGSFTLRAGDEKRPVRLRVVGRHNVFNALAAAACAHALGLPVLQIAAGLEAFAGVPGRLGFSRGPRGECIIDDTYNANPASMRAALDVLAAQSGARYFVMGDMGELGGDAPALHRDIGAYARQKAIDGLFALGQFTRETVSVYGPGAAHFETIETLVDALAPKLDERATVLVKGSRFMAMERLVAALRAPTKREG